MLGLILSILLAFRVQLFESLVYSLSPKRVHKHNSIHNCYTKNVHPKSTLRTKCLTTNMLTQDAIAEGFSNAFVGGTVGVMSVAFILEVRKLQDKSLDGCPYCLGNGEILCAFCLGQGIGLENDACSCCSGRGLVTCINCKGDGRETPIMLQSKAVRNPEYASDGISIDSA